MRNSTHYYDAPIRRIRMLTKNLTGDEVMALAGIR
jgi:hypothetical protein